MIKYIIVSNDVVYIKKIRDVINNLYNKHYEIGVYKEVDANLLREIKNLDVKKVYFLGVELNGNISGIKLGEMIRSEGDWQSEIIIVTKHEKMFESCHRRIYKICTFIETFADFEEKLTKVLKEINKNYNLQDKLLYKDLCIFYHAILYIYRDKNTRKLNVVTDTHEYPVALSIKEMLSLLDHRFKQSHRSCIVNKERVEYLNYKEGLVTLDNKDKFCLLSEKFRNNFEDLEPNNV